MNQILNNAVTEINDNTFLGMCLKHVDVGDTLLTTMKKEKICGIYRITSPIGKICIGQSIDIQRRLKHYETLNCKKQTKLYNSLNKYGYENHLFEIIELCPREHLNYYEIYYIWFYETYKTEYGMNLTRGGSSPIKRIFSEEAKKGSSKRSKEVWEKRKASGKPLFSEEHRKNLSDAAKEVRKRKKLAGEPIFSEKALLKKAKSCKRAWEKRKADPNFYSEENKKKRSEDAKKGGTRTEEQRKNMSIAKQKIKHIINAKNRGQKRTQEQKLRIKHSLPKYTNPEEYWSEESRKIRSDRQKKKIILNIETGIFYFGLEEAAASTNLTKTKLTTRLNGYVKNKTSLINV